MAENKKCVILYCDIIHTVEELSDDEAGKLFKHYLRYVNDKDPIPPDKLTQVVFEPIKQALKRDLKKWEEVVEKRRKAGNISAEIRKQKPTHVKSVEQIPTHSTDRDSDNVKDSVNDINIEKEIFESLKFEIVNADRWISDTCRILKQSEANLRGLLNQFLDELYLKQDFYKDVKDTQSHFINWVKKQIEKQNKEQKPTGPGSINFTLKSNQKK